MHRFQPDTALFAGTHSVLVAIGRKKTAIMEDSVEVWFHTEYPNGKDLMPRLARFGSVYAGAVTLDQIGNYTFMVHLVRGDDTPAITFQTRMEKP